MFTNKTGIHRYYKSHIDTMAGREYRKTYTETFLAFGKENHRIQHTIAWVVGSVWIWMGVNQYSYWKDDTNFSCFSGIYKPTFMAVLHLLEYVERIP